MVIEGKLGVLLWISVKDPALSLEQLGSLLHFRFCLWPENFQMPQAWQERKKKGGKEIEKKEGRREGRRLRNERRKEKERKAGFTLG